MYSKSIFALMFGLFVLQAEAMDEKTRSENEHKMRNAVIDQNYNEVKQLLDDGVDVDLKYAEGETLLIVAARVGNLKIVQLLIERGANTCATDHDGDTADRIAELKKHHDVADYLRMRTNRCFMYTRYAQQLGKHALNALILALMYAQHKAQNKVIGKSV